MPKRSIAVYKWPAHKRSQIIADAMFKGIRACGGDPAMLDAREYRRGQSDIAVFYGFKSPMTNAFKWQRETRGKAVYVDLGYFGRHFNGRWRGYHKISVGARHPVHYFQNRQHDRGRFISHGIKIQPWRRGGRKVIIAGMSAKAAEAEGLRHMEWEMKALRRLKSVTDRPIVFRPKPSDRSLKRLPGVGYSPPQESLIAALSDAHCVVTHHSNVAIDAILSGIPAIVFGGVAATMGSQNFADIENLPKPDGREQWAANIAWTQWNIDEMKNGQAWRYLMSEGLV